MSRIYCSLTDVKRLLRSVITKESKVRFSEAYRDLKMDSRNTGSIVLGSVSFNDAFASHETYAFEFTDSTSYIVTGDVVGRLGTGAMTETFTLDEMFSVASSDWEGSANTGDKCYITAASDISNDDGHDFIVDNTKRINAHLEHMYGTLSSVGFYDSTSEVIPDGVNFACIRWTAWDIFNSIHAGLFPDNESPVDKWKTAADDSLKAYLSGHGAGPRWKSRVALITVLGDAKVGDGIIEITQLPDATNKQYER